MIFSVCLDDALDVFRWFSRRISMFCYSCPTIFLAVFGDLVVFVFDDVLGLFRWFSIYSMIPWGCLMFCYFLLDVFLDLSRCFTCFARWFDLTFSTKYSIVVDDVLNFVKWFSRLYLLMSSTVPILFWALFKWFSRFSSMSEFLNFLKWLSGIWSMRWLFFSVIFLWATPSRVVERVGGGLGVRLCDEFTPSFFDEFLNLLRWFSRLVRWFSSRVVFGDCSVLLKDVLDLLVSFSTFVWCFCRRYCSVMFSTSFSNLLSDVFPRLSRCLSMMF